MKHIQAEIEVNSLSSFFKVIEEKNLSESIFRGECEYFEKREASAFRLGVGKRYNTFRIHEEFKNKVIANLTMQELEHFSAFCQHHALPTDLLDFTISPLVALYFACQNKENSAEGYVYSIKKKRLINITDLINSCDKRNLMNIFLGNIDSKLCLSFKYKIKQYFSENPDIMPKCLLEIVDNYKIWDYNFKLNPIPKTNTFDLVAFRNKLEMSQNEVRFNVDVNEIYQSITGVSYNETVGGEADSAAIIYILLLKQYFINVTHYCASTISEDKEKISEFNCNIVFTYTPPNIFKRIVAQQGLFVNQTNLSRTIKKELLIKQKIESDIIIKVQNKREILNQLDQIGINQATIYNDYDNIAKYVTEKFK